MLPVMPVAVGEMAPDFVLKDQNNQDVRLSDFRARRPVLLVFYPLAFTSVCGSELHSLSSLPAGVQVLTVSVDSMFTHRAWADAENFQFGLLADFWPHGAVAQAYGVLDEARGVSTRGTFVIDKEGIVRWKVVNPIPQARDIADYQKALAALA